MSTPAPLPAFNFPKHALLRFSEAQRTKIKRKEHVPLAFMHTEDTFKTQTNISLVSLFLHVTFWSIFWYVRNIWGESASELKTGVPFWFQWLLNKLWSATGRWNAKKQEKDLLRQAVSCFTRCFDTTLASVLLDNKYLIPYPDPQRQNTYPQVIYYHLSSTGSRGIKPNLSGAWWRLGSL